jgi:hypothetical protein
MKKIWFFCLIVYFGLNPNIIYSQTKTQVSDIFGLWNGPNDQYIFITSDKLMIFHLFSGSSMSRLFIIGDTRYWKVFPNDDTYTRNEYTTTFEFYGKVFMVGTEISNTIGENWELVFILDNTKTKMITVQRGQNVVFEKL